MRDNARHHPREREDSDITALWEERKIDRLAFLSAIAGVVLLHGGITMLPFPIAFREIAERWENEAAIVVDLEPIERTPSEFTSQRFVQTNPDALSNAPDHSDNFAARDQQAAQPEPDVSDRGDGIPHLKGDLPESGSIVERPTGSFPAQDQAIAADSIRNDLMESEVGAEDFMPLDEKPTRSEQQQQHPIPGGPTAPLTGEGAASWLDLTEQNHDVAGNRGDEPVHVTLNPLATLQHQESDPQRQSNDGANGDVQRRRPMPRPRLSGAQDVLMDHQHGVSRAGLIAIDANFSQFGDYLQRMFDAIGQRWNQLAMAGIRSYSELRSQVVIEFDITLSGEVEDLRVVYSSADNVRTLICKDAIASRAPYGQWTEDMVAVLGERQPIRFTFHYR